jgi:Mrp family chromosome partitioning ATPase
MSKIFEALQNARDEVKGPEILAEPRAAIPSAVPLPSMFPELSMEEEMVRLHQHLDVLLPDVNHKVVQFIGTRQGEGASTAANEFARVSAARFGQRVLLLDADPYKAPQASPEAVQLDDGGPTASASRDPEGVAPYQIGNASLFVGTLPHGSGSTKSAAGSPQADAFWERLRQRFDLVLVDSLPAVTSADGLAISSKVDGVILVVEAETTRWPVAENLRDSILRSGGKVLGIVFNKRRYYIPDFIYKRL